MKKLLGLILLVSSLGQAKPFEVRGFIADPSEIVTPELTAMGATSIVGLEDYLASVPADEPVYIDINSNGGHFSPRIEGLLLILRSRESHCHISGMAASMALALFSNCKYRTAAVDSVLMWHTIRVGMFGVYMSSIQLRQMADELDAKSDKLWALLKICVNDDEFFQFSSDAELMHGGARFFPMFPKCGTVTSTPFDE